MRPCSPALLTVIGFAPAPAQAGFFDFLFGNSQDQQQPQPQSYAEPPPPALGRVAPAPLGAESVRQGGGSSGRAMAYCVRLCDGAHFPIERLANATPVEACRAMCPASQTKVFYGSEIGGAVAKDGARYADLDTAFIYRQHLVANCTCNGRNARGLAPFDLSSDPTLRPGDIVSTKDGFVAFTGKPGQADAFTPVDPASIATELQLGHLACRRRFPADPGDAGRRRCGGEIAANAAGRSRRRHARPDRPIKGSRLPSERSNLKVPTCPKIYGTCIGAAG